MTRRDNYKARLDWLANNQHFTKDDYDLFICKLIKRFPMINIDYWDGPPRRLGESWEEHKHQLLLNPVKQARLFHWSTYYGVLRSAFLLSGISWQKRPTDRSVGSYSLKHIFERWWGRVQPGVDNYSEYVADMEVKLAASFLTMPGCQDKVIDIPVTHESVMSVLENTCPESFSIPKVHKFSDPFHDRREAFE